MTKPYLLTILLCVPLQAEVIALRNARVIDGTGAAPRVETVLIRDTHIDGVAPDLAIPPGARVIDANGKTLLPGLFDLHTHLSASAATGISGDWGKILLAYLASGVTTVNDFSAYGEMFSPLRKLIDSRVVEAPHVRFAHRLSTPGGHGTEGGWGDYFTLTASTAEEAHAQMKRILPYKPDAIKIFTDGWRYDASPDLSSMNQETIAAIVEDAHRAGIRVFTHTVTLRGAKTASRAGIDALAHGIGDATVDQELIDIMKSKGTSYIPTLSVYEPRAAGPPNARAVPLLEPAILDMFAATPRTRSSQKSASDEPSPRARRWKFLLENVRRLHEAGIPVACGTDAGMAGTYHGYSTLHELELLVKAGMTPMNAITAATRTSARAAGVDRERGTIARGMTADLLLVDGKPDENIRDVQKTSRVFLAGRELDPRALEAAIAKREMTPLPVEKVAAQIDEMENPDRTLLGTLRVDSTDAGPDHSKLMFLPIVREGNNHSLMLQAVMADKAHPWVRLELPLTKGGIDLADVSAYKGVSFVARGECNCRMLLTSYGIRDHDFFQAPFRVAGGWSAVKIPFSEMKTRERAAKSSTGTSKWNPRDVRTLEFELSGAAGSKVWLELDKVEFY